jgi:hypothetical protein
VCLLLNSAPAGAWGAEGHAIIGLIAEHYLEPAVRTRVSRILSADRSRLTTGTDIAAEASWADRYRDSDRQASRLHYNQTRNWHFVDLELDGPDLKTACYGQPPPPPGRAALRGPAADCIVDKVDEFVAELRNGRTPGKEKLAALQFVLHLVGDLHQPLHAADNHDEGGNRETATAPGIPYARLHGDWDTAFVQRLGLDEREVAQRLIAKITTAQRASWSTGTSADWALESFLVAKQHAYGKLPKPVSTDNYVLSAAYVDDATAVTAEQLSKAGVRLAYVLNRAMR